MYSQKPQFLTVHSTRVTQICFFEILQVCVVSLTGVAKGTGRFSLEGLTQNAEIMVDGLTSDAYL